MQALPRKVVIDPSCYSQFDLVKAASTLINMDKEAFAEKINEFYLQVKGQGGLKDGYAPFCKHLFIENFTEMHACCAEITPENQPFIRCEYVARNERELPVLSRWFDAAQMPTHRATFLDIILYSKEQVQAENAAMGTTDPNAEVDYDYGIIWVKP